MANPLVRIELRDRVAVISLNRPEKHNAFSDEMTRAFDEVLKQALSDDDARALLIRAEGPSFCTGRDTNELGHRQYGESDYEHVRRAQLRTFALVDAPKPVVSAVHGHAIGGGFELALASDVRIAADDTVISVPEIRYGLLPDTGASQILTALIGPSRTKLLMLTGRAMTAQQAEQWGAIDLVVPLAKLDETAFEIASAMAAKPPIALAMGKQLANHAWSQHLRTGLGMELLAQTALFRTDDYREARSAVREKRTPKYKGR